jgi:hypothetical protein
LLDGADDADDAHDKSMSAITVSQKTSLPKFGVPPRTFLEHLSSGRFEGEIFRKGKLRLVDVSAYRDFLSKSNAVKEDGSGPETVLAELGLRVVRGKRP